MRSLNSSEIESVTYPTLTRTIDGASYEIPDEPAAGAVLTAFLRGESLGLLVEGPVRVQILNGNGIPGAAARSPASWTMPALSLSTSAMPNLMTFRPRSCWPGPIVSLPRPGCRSTRIRRDPARNTAAGC